MGKEPMAGEQRRILTVVLVPVFISLLAVSSINVVLPAIQTSISASEAQIQWVLSGYTLAFGVLLVAAGRAGDVYGRGWPFTIGLGLFGLGSLLSGLSSNGALLDASRLLMGVGSGTLNPQTVGFIQQYFEGARRARAFASFGAVVGLSVAIGPLLGGGLVGLLGDEWGWRATFLVNVPIALIGVVLGRLWLPATAFQSGDSQSRPDLDPVGMLLFASSMLLLMVPFLERARGAWILALLPAGVVLLLVWLRWERRYERRGGQPMVDLGLFRVRSYANGTLLIGLQFTGITSIWVIIAMYLQNGHGATAWQAALVGLPSAFATAAFSTFAGRVVLKMGRRLVGIGITTVLASMLLTMAIVWGHATFGISPWWMTLSLTLLGAGQGMVVSPNQTLSMLEVPPEQSGSAGGVMQTGQRVGTAMGTAIITATFFAVRPALGWNWAFLAAFALVAALVVAALVVAIVDIRGTAARQAR